MPTASLASSYADADPFTLSVPTALGLAMNSRVLAIQARHRRQTGERLSLSDALRLLMDAVEAEPMPLRRDLERVRWWLVNEGYTDQAIAGAIEDIRECGTAQCTRWVDEADRDHVESLLELHPDWNNPRWSKERVNLGLNAEPIAGQF